MNPSVRPHAYALLAVLLLACARPERIQGFVGRSIEAFMADGALRPLKVTELPDGRTYLFEVTETVTTSVPPAGPARPLNIENRAQPLPLGPGPQAFEPGRAVPGTPEPRALHQAAGTRTRFLSVATGPDGRIRSFAYAEPLGGGSPAPGRR